MRLPNAIRKWQFLSYTNGDCIALGGEEQFVGTWEEAQRRAHILVIKHETEEGFIDAMEIESQGIMWQGPGKDGGLA